MGSWGSKKNIAEPSKVTKTEQPQQTTRRRTTRRNPKPSLEPVPAEVPKLDAIPFKKQPKYDPIKRDLPPLPLSKESRSLIKQMKLDSSFPIKFVETGMILNALMAIKELKFGKTDVIMYDIREFWEYSSFHFCHSQHYDIGTWSDTYMTDLCKITRFKYLFIISDSNTFQSTDFTTFIESLSKSLKSLKWTWLFFYNINLKDITDQNLNHLLVHNQTKTKLNYYPSLIIENPQLWWGGLFLANHNITDIQNEYIDQYISEVIYLGDEDKGKLIKDSIKVWELTYTTQDVNQNTMHVWDKICERIKKKYSKNENILLISSDPDNLGVLIAMYFLMNVKGYSYVEANKYVVEMRFKIGITHKFASFLKFLFVSQEERPETPPQQLSDRNRTPTINLEEQKKPEIDVNDTFQMKLRKNKIKKPNMQKKSSIDEGNAEDILLQKYLDSLYSQVKKKI